VLLAPVWLNSGTMETLYGFESMFSSMSEPSAILIVVKANGWMGMKERAPPLVGHWERFVEGGMPVFFLNHIYLS